VTGEIEAVARVVRHLDALGISYMVAGSMASSFHGRPRTTQDADIVIDPTADQLDRIVAGLSEAGFYVDQGRARDALRRRQFNVIDPSSAFKLDLIIRKDRPFSREEFARRLRAALGESLEVVLATAEDTILSKLEWSKLGGGSERQLADVGGMIELKGADLDRDYIERWARVLGVLDLWRQADRGSAESDN
jgi:hypothetical protein